jgi:hypothetical protein
MLEGGALLLNKLIEIVLKGHNNTQSILEKSTDHENPCIAITIVLRPSLKCTFEVTLLPFRVNFRVTCATSVRFRRL